MTHERFKWKSTALLFFAIVLVVVLVAGTPATSIGEETPTPPPADTSPFPTVRALEQTLVPQRDPVDLARRLNGVTHIPPTPASAPTLSRGERRTFWASDLSGRGAFQLEATLQVVGEHIYIWVETGVSVPVGQLEALAHAFDNTIYPDVRTLWGSEALPGIDGDPHVYALFARGLGVGTAAYFAADHTYPAAVMPNSNENEMFFINLDAVTGDMASPAMRSVIAHEFQHMVRQNVDPNEDSWLDEGFSTFTERYLGSDNPLGAAVSFMRTPQTQLNTWTETGDRVPDYGATFLFVDYFFERYGLAGLRALSSDPANGLRSVDHVLREMGEPGVDTFFADWVLANYLLEPDGRYGYKMLAPDIPSPIPFATVSAYPFNTTADSNQYATHYYVLPDVRGRTALDIQLSAPDTVRLVPAQPPSGRWMWYSNRGDGSDTTLTRTVDLSGVDSATLNYRLWYHIEQSWDFGYVMASGDGGTTWQPLTTPRTTDHNPYRKAYGPGYTGRSDGWLTESVSLDDYTGDEAMIRFEMITDDAINQPGMAIDDVRIPEIDFHADFEDGGDGWQASGWIRTDNRLPQRVWVQAVQQMGDDFSVTRWSATGDGAWTLALQDGVDQVILAVSPFAPVTTVPVTYTLEIDAR